MQELLNRSLPKWPQMIVTGKKLSDRRALEIIRRTDSFFEYQGGNNRDFIKKAIDILQIPQYDDYKDNFAEYMQQSERWRNKWNYISTEYVKNSWISCSFIGGVHGWCHPDGTIWYDDNIGKWPSIEEVHEEWTRLAEAFPFIELGVTLMSGEDGDDNIHPVVSFKIKKGKVEIVDPELENVNAGYYQLKVEKPKIDIADILNSRRENAIPLITLDKWHHKVFKQED